MIVNPFARSVARRGLRVAVFFSQNDALASGLIRPPPAFLLGKKRRDLALTTSQLSCLVLEIEVTAGWWQWEGVSRVGHGGLKKDVRRSGKVF